MLETANTPVIISLPKDKDLCILLCLYFEKCNRHHIQVGSKQSLLVVGVRAGETVLSL